MGCGASAAKGAKYATDAQASGDASAPVNVAVAVASQLAPSLTTSLAPALSLLAGALAGGGDGPEDSMEEDDDVISVADPERVDLDLEQAISRQEGIVTLMELGFTKAEAVDMYEEVAEEIAAEGGSVEDGIPLCEILEELKIDAEDFESLRAVSVALNAARAKLEETGGEAPEEDEAAGSRGLGPAADKIVRELDLEKRPAEDAWAVVQEGKVPLSKAQRAMVDTFEGREDELVEFVRKCMQEPPLINSTGGQNACRELCVAEVNRIIEECQAAGTQFTDPDWDMTSAPEAVLYVDKAAPGWDCTVAEPAGYKRLSEIVENIQLFKGGIRAGDIIQGQIGTCFLLGAMGAVASNNKDGVKRMFIKYDTQVGVYGVRFCIDGEWSYVVVDDWMPVDGNGQLLYARSNDPEEVWCPVLEKAYCKLHTCYEMCDGGFATEAIFNFFGGVSGKIDVTDDHRADPSTYFKALDNARKKGWLLTTAFQPKAAASAGSGKCGEATFESGLVGGHCYSVLKMVEALGHQLICCRNPWGTGEWRGKWSDLNSEGEWTDEMKEACGYSGLNDGKFWMSIQDFIENSGGVSYARQFGPTWKKVTQYKHFAKGPMLATAKAAYEAQADDEIGFEQGAAIQVRSIAAGWWYGRPAEDAEAKDGFFPGRLVCLNDRPVARFDWTATKTEGAAGPMTLVVMLTAPDSTRLRKFYRRKEDGMNYKDLSYPCVKIVLINGDQVQMKKVGCRHTLWGEVKLEGDSTQGKIFAYSVDGLGGAFSLRCYVKDCSFSLVEVPGASISELKDAIAPR